LRAFALKLILLREMTDVTRILEKVNAGEDPRAADELLSLIYNELHTIARSRMAGESPGHTLQPTALVNEAWIRLFPEGQNPEFKGRAHFFAAAATAMRRILVDHARRKRAEKRNAGKRVDLTDSQLVEVAHPSSPEEILAVDDALNRLAAQDQPAADLVKFHYFVGMTMREAADALDISERQAERLWAYAKTWLRREIGQDMKS
jgi:RNA polymerase sigma factor (TIGR02999 family)